MKKLLVLLVSVLALTGCGEDEQELKQLNKGLSTIQEELQSCQGSLSAYKNAVTYHLSQQVDREDSESLKDAIREVGSDLYDCQSRLNSARAGGEETSRDTTSNDSDYEQDNTPAEPQYEEVEVVELTNERTTCTNWEETACGMTLRGCENGYSYFCQTNVKLKGKTIQKLVEE